MSNMTLKRFSELVGLKAGSWDEMRHKVIDTCEGLGAAEGRATLLEKDLARLLAVRNRRRARWTETATTALKLALGGFIGAYGGLWPWYPSGKLAGLVAGGASGSWSRHRGASHYEVTLNRGVWSCTCPARFTCMAQDATG